MRTNNIYSLKLITFHWLNVNIDIADRDSINCVLLYIFSTYSVCVSVCMSLCVCVWAMLPDSNKMTTMMIKFWWPVASCRLP